MKLLLYTENKEGFHPLEFAGKEGTLQLFSAMLNTDRAYLARHEMREGTVYGWYNISEYEPKHGEIRYLKYPLISLLHIDKGRLSHPSVKKVLSITVSAAMLLDQVPDQSFANEHHV